MIKNVRMPLERPKFNSSYPNHLIYFTLLIKYCPFGNFLFLVVYLQDKVKANLFLNAKI